MVAFKKSWIWFDFDPPHIFIFQSFPSSFSKRTLYHIPTFLILNFKQKIKKYIYLIFIFPRSSTNHKRLQLIISLSSFKKFLFHSLCCRLYLFLGFHFHHCILNFSLRYHQIYSFVSFTLSLLCLFSITFLFSFLNPILGFLFAL
jgi:hypothetical protein